MIVTNIEEEVALVHQLLSHPAGFEVGNSGVLQARQYDRPQANGCAFVVERERYRSGRRLAAECSEFKTAREAAECFVAIHHKIKLGLDFEKGEKASP